MCSYLRMQRMKVIFQKWPSVAFQLPMRADVVVQIFHNRAKFACLGLEVGLSRAYNRAKFNVAIKTFSCQFHPDG